MKTGSIITSCVGALVALSLLDACQSNKQETTNNLVIECQKDSLDHIVVNTPQEALSQLIQGNERFVCDSAMHPDVSKNYLRTLCNEQHPFACVIGCSDSRVPIELLFDQGAGDIFVVRNAGNSVHNDVEMGSVEYAAEHLGVKIIVLMGHEKCGAVTAAITPEDGHTHHEGALTNLIEDLRHDVENYVGDQDHLQNAVETNIKVQTERIKQNPIIAKAIEEGKLIVVGACYSIDSNKVSFFS